MQNYTYSTCAHENMSAWTIDTEVGCATDGVATRTCLADGCGYTETEYIPAAGHTLSDWTAAEGNTEERACSKCDYVVSRVKNENAVQFDDGTILDGDNISITVLNTKDENGETVPVEIDENATEVGNDYVWYSVVAGPNRLGENVLKIHTVKANYVVPYKGPRLNLTPMNEGATGNVYTLDFDMYVEAATITNSSYVIFQVAFGAHTLSYNTYGSNVRIYVDPAVNIAAIDTWVSVRMVYTVTADGEANLEIFTNDASGAYQSVYTTSITNAAIKLDGTNMYFSSYSSGMDHTYYLDNIYLTRTAAAAE